MRALLLWIAVAKGAGLVCVPGLAVPVVAPAGFEPVENGLHHPAEPARAVTARSVPGPSCRAFFVEASELRGERVAPTRDRPSTEFVGLRIVRDVGSVRHELWCANAIDGLVLVEVHAPIDLPVSDREVLFGIAEDLRAEIENGGRCGVSGG